MRKMVGHAHMEGEELGGGEQPMVNYIPLLLQKHLRLYSELFPCQDLPTG